MRGKFLRRVRLSNIDKSEVEEVRAIGALRKTLRGPLYTDKAKPLKETRILRTEQELRQQGARRRELLKTTMIRQLLATTSLRAVSGGGGYAESSEWRPAWVTMSFLEAKITLQQDSRDRKRQARTGADARCANDSERARTRRWRTCHVT
eukprot:4883411-Pleurochrysis_carterae.AAC.1